MLGEIRVHLMPLMLHRVRLMKDRQLSFFHGARPTWLLLHWVGCFAVIYLGYAPQRREHRSSWGLPHGKKKHRASF